jgi:2-keto-4-pentenoate hydratase
MAWLADELPRFGRGLRVGDVVTTGVTTGVFEAVAGDSVEARFDGVGDVAVHFG